MANILEAFGTNGQTITVTMNSLASAGARQSTVIDNTSTLYTDVLVMIKAKNHASSAPTGQKCINVYVGGTVDNGTTQTENAGASDAAITLDSPTHLKFLGQITFSAAAQTKFAGPWSVAQAFGGVVPQKWFLVVENQTGFALDATAADAAFSKLYQGVYYTVA